jgi:hypothetical protein
VLAIAAGGGAGSADAAIAAIALAPRSPELAATAFEASKLLKSPRVGELVTIVDGIVDEALSEEPSWGAYRRFDRLVPLFRRQIAHGEPQSVRRLLERALRIDAASVAQVLRVPGLLWPLSTEAAQLIPLINAMEPGDRYSVLVGGLRACIGWSREDLDTLIALADVRSELGKELAQAGRLDDARHVMFDDQPGEWREPAFVAEDYLVVGDEAGAKRALEGQTQQPDHVMRLRIQLGLESLADAIKPLAKPSKIGVMSNVLSLIDLAKLALERGELDALDDIDAAIEKLLAAKQRSQYDHGIEGNTRNIVADQRARIAARRDPSSLRALIEADIAGLAALHAYGKDAWKRGQLTEGVARRALEHGFPALALLAAKKLRFDPGSNHVPHMIASAFLPADPAAALHAFDTLVKEPDKAFVLLHHMQEPLLAQLWSAVAS